MKNPFKDQIIIDGLQYCNWNRELFEDLWRGSITAVHATLVYWENTEESFAKIKEWEGKKYTKSLLRLYYYNWLFYLCESVSSIMFAYGTYI